MASGNFTAGVVPTPPLTVNQFFATPPVTPGNVGVCLSGGGSRALTAGMGQLQALAYLTANGAPLLGQAKALSTVSGGSWLGVPFEFLRPSGPTDAAYLGVYDPDQANLTIAQLESLPTGNAGVPITSDLFLPELLAVEAYLLYRYVKVPPSMLWQTVIALNILSTYGLFSPDLHLAPTDLFSYDAQSLTSMVTGPNPGLAAQPANLFADGTGQNRIRRPYLICNMAMFLNEPGTQVELLAPVQATPFFTGIVGSPEGTDANGLAVGGGGVTSFAFNSIYVSSSGAAATVAQQRQWSLTDIVGTSSAFFAEIVQNQIAEWQANPWKLAETLWKYGDEIWKWIERHFDSQAQAAPKAFVRHHAHHVLPSAVDDLAARTFDDLAVLKFSFSDLQSIDPAYYYWSPAHEQVVSMPQPTRFADGGNLENTGIGGMLAYSDIDKLISFVNTEIPMAVGQYGVSDGSGGYIPGTKIIVDESIPPLFGYQPYESGQVDEYYKGYVTYAGNPNTDYPEYAHNQVFPSSEFPAFLQNIWANSASGAAPAIYAQSLPVVANGWFGVTGRKTVTVVWCYLAMVSTWQNQFQNNPAVAAAVQSAVMNMSFPHYNTLDTSLSATEVNLLAALTGWCVVSADQQSQVFSGLFTG
jgi:hypothetical protein